MRRDYPIFDAEWKTAVVKTAVLDPTQLDITTVREDHRAVCIEFEYSGSRRAFASEVARPSRQDMHPAAIAFMWEDVAALKPVPWHVDPDSHHAIVTKQNRELAALHFSPAPRKHWPL